MHRKRMALLSTWQERCGIAHYSWFLKRALEPHLDIEVLPLPRALMLNNTSRHAIAAADQHVRETAEKLKDFDIVNFQFEPGVIARDWRAVIRRTDMLLKASRAVVFTFHSINRQRPPQVTRYAAIALRNGPLQSLAEAIRDRYRNQWPAIYRIIGKAARRKPVSAIAHSVSDAKEISLAVSGIEVRHHPLTYMDDAFLANIPQRASRSRLAQSVPRPKDGMRFIGVFGFIAQHKGIDTAIKALEHLPPEYHLLCFCSIHESAMVDEGTVSCLQDLIALSEKVPGRVHWIGSVSDDDVLFGMMMCDAILLPYSSTQHSASGPASLAIELNRRIYCSRAGHFRELARYFPAHLSFCDAGNQVEFAQKILTHTRDREDRTVNGMRWVYYPQKERPLTIRDTVRNYLDAAGVPFAEQKHLSIAAE